MTLHYPSKWSFQLRLPDQRWGCLQCHRAHPARRAELHRNEWQRHSDRRCKSNVLVICKSSTTRFAYVANAGSSTISQYTVGSSGALTAMATASIATGTTPYSVTVDPTGHYVYVANYLSGTVSQYVVGSSGAVDGDDHRDSRCRHQPAFVTTDPSGKYRLCGKRSAAAPSHSTR